MKRTFLLSILAIFPAALMPLAAISQILPAHRAAAEGDEPSFKYELYAGFGYTSLNNVNQSRSGLMGVNASVTRDFGKYFGITADGGYYKYATVSGNPGSPVVDMFFMGPVIHANLYGKTSGFIHALLGLEHLGGETVTPNISFAGGFGCGLEYSVSKRLSIRASGDDIGSAFSVTGNSSALGYSPHTTFGARATVGAVYKF